MERFDELLFEAVDDTMRLVFGESASELIYTFMERQVMVARAALLDIKLPGIEGTKLLTTMHKTLPKMTKIMITGYPSLENAVESLNHGADAYLIKPVKPEKLLALIEEKLEEQSQAEKMIEEKVTEWIKTRAHKIEHDL